MSGGNDTGAEMGGRNHVEPDRLREFSRTVLTQSQNAQDNPAVKSKLAPATGIVEWYGDTNRRTGDSLRPPSTLPEAKGFWEGRHSTLSKVLGAFLNDGLQCLTAISIAAGSAVVAYQTQDDVSADDITNAAFVPNGLLKKDTLGRFYWEQAHKKEYPDADNDGYADHGDLDTDGDGNLDTDDADIDGDGVPNTGDPNPNTIPAPPR